MFLRYPPPSPRISISPGFFFKLNLFWPVSLDTKVFVNSIFIFGFWPTKCIFWHQHVFYMLKIFPQEVKVFIQ